MDLTSLRIFLAVAEERSFSRAAAKVHRTQPAVSQIIRKLEREIGEALFDRSSRDGTLTDAGRVLLQNAEKLLNLRTETQRELSDLRRLQSGRVSVAANEFTALYLLPVLHQFRRLHPMIQVAVRRSLASHIPQELLAHTVELGMLSYDPQEPQLRSIVVYRDELSFVVYPEHPLARLKQVRIKQLGAETFVAHNVPSPYRAKVLEAFRRHRTPLHMDVELPTIEAIKLFVARGNGVALVPRISIERELQSGELVQVGIKELKLERKLRIVYRKGAVLSHAARALLQVMQTAAAEQRGRFLFQRE